MKVERKGKLSVGMFLTITFFLGFPVAGLLFFWGDMHRKLSASAQGYVFETLTPLVRDWGRDAYYDETNATYRSRIDLPTWEKTANEWRGSTLKEADVVMTYARETNDMATQYAKVEGLLVRDGRPSGTLFVTLSRPTNAPRWRIESLYIK